MKRTPLGTSEFEKVRTQNYLYVDKTDLIIQVLSSAEVLLLTRPRRFGKTLNLTMLHSFFDQNRDSRLLFEGLAVAGDAATMAHLNAHPTIFMSFKDIGGQDWAESQLHFQALITAIFRTHQVAIETLTFDKEEKAFLDAVYTPGTPVATLVQSLKRLTEWLYKATGKKAVLLIDEYDSPLHQGHAHGYYSEIVSFMRGFMGRALKDNPYLERAVITGILRVGKESIYSGLNNLSVFSVLDEKFATCFGFTEPEVAQLLQESNSPHSLSAIQSWYNGYHFGNQTIYNPWSILTMLDQGAAGLKAHWIGTSGNQLIADLIRGQRAITIAQTEALLRGENLECHILESVPMAEIDARSVWSLLLYSGYLTVNTWAPDTMTAQLRLPNLEVRSFFQDTVVTWLGSGPMINALVKSLLELRFEDFAHDLAESVKSILSYNDLGGPEKEKTYHVFVVGLLTQLGDRYEVVSNRESGHGRYDLALYPRKPGDPGFIFEFKQAQRNNLAEAANLAHTQIGARDYGANLRDRGVTQIASIGIAFSGKRIALACSTFETQRGTSSEISRYSAGVDVFTSPPQINHRDTVSADPSLNTQKAIIVGRIQTLQHIKGKTVTPETELLRMDLSALEAISEALSP